MFANPIARVAPVKNFSWLAVWLFLMSASCGPSPKPPVTVLKETHPFQESLLCKRAKSDVLRGELYAVGAGREILLSVFNSGHVASCEWALRSSRHGRVCIENQSEYKVIEVASQALVRRFGQDFAGCLAFTKNWEGLATRAGFVQFIDRQELGTVLQNLPSVTDQRIDGVLKSAETMWYDEASMVFTYQDSFGRPGGPEGLRANRVGYDVGSTSTVPDIKALTEYFDPGRFKFPFAVTAGGGDQSNSYVLNFWSVPRDSSGAFLPVIWWKNESHWHWTFPKGTVLGEVLLMREPVSRAWHVFEVRSRVRELDHWTTDIFRPFISAADFAAEIRQQRPQWASTDLADLVKHLENPGNLVPARLDSTPYKKIFPTINGFHDELPATADVALIKTLLTERVFQSAMNTQWKVYGLQKTYAPTTQAGFHIVPRGYIAGLLESSEASCQRCHTQTGRPLGQLDSRVVLYGEIWGEDQVFTWHPFKLSNDLFTVSDGSRFENPRMVEAGLLRQRHPVAGDPYYRELPKPYPAVYH